MVRSIIEGGGMWVACLHISCAAPGLSCDSQKIAYNSPLSLGQKVAFVTSGAEDNTALDLQTIFDIHFPAKPIRILCLVIFS